VGGATPDAVFFVMLLLFVLNMPSSRFLVTVKDELKEAPPTRRRRHGGGGVVIREQRQPSLPRQLQPVKREWTPPP
jgi:hypothetical protein